MTQTMSPVVRQLSRMIEDEHIKSLPDAALVQLFSAGRDQAAFHATWCGPCWRLSRFLDANRDIWEKDFLWIKLDRRWKHADSVADRLRQKARGGIPWTAILDAEGKVLATSNDKEGQNVGFPSDAAAISHFSSMLSTRALRLAPAEIERLARALRNLNSLAP